MEITRRSLLSGALALALSASPAVARLHGGAGASNSASPSGTFLTAPTGTLTDWQGNVWGWGAPWIPTSGYSGGYYVTKNGITQQGIGTPASASWSLGAATITVSASLAITSGMAIYDGTITSTPTYIGTVQSYVSGTGVVTLVSGALAASGGSADALAFGQNTWATGLLYLDDVVYFQDPSNKWMAYSDQNSPTQQWNNIFGDPRSFSPTVSSSGTVDSTALAPTSIPSDPSWP